MSFYRYRVEIKLKIGSSLISSLTSNVIFKGFQAVTNKTKKLNFAYFYGEKQRLLNNNNLMRDRNFFL